MIDSAVTPSDGITSTVNEKWNTVKKILQITCFPATEGEIRTTDYKTLSRYQSKGIIYMRNEVTEKEAKEMKEDIRCTTHDIVMARQTGILVMQLRRTFQNRGRHSVPISGT